MNSLPKVGDTDFAERAGINRVAETVNGARCIWRELLQKDIGIDGHIEYVTPDGYAPGRIIAVQVKSGASWFRGSNKEFLSYTARRSHAEYWARYPLPVVLVLHNPATSETIWVDARASLRTRGQDAPIAVPRRQRFDILGVLDALKSDGPLPEGEFQVDAVLRKMANSAASAQSLSFITLFAQGMTDIAHSLFFSMGIVSEVLGFNAAKHKRPTFNIEQTEFDFIDEYVHFLIANDLARIDYGSWLQSSRELGMVGTFIAPLSQKGRMVRDRIATIDAMLPETNGDPKRYPAIQERFVDMLINRTGVDELAIRQNRLDLVERYILDGAITS
ncbi:DUF4365 domain-containing protein [Nocardia sienata]|uniref:DUF4365 domain-containing protein n=1 Tax=Nocardia sienata TaxID=248552 RepID=UPI000AA32FD9|nr:DUF4365 domain-containing protein [Nocardia sienata]